MMPWLCPRCHKMNAPWLNQCFCGPVLAPITEPPHQAPVSTAGLKWSPISGYGEPGPDGSFTLQMDEENQLLPGGVKPSV